MFYGCSDEPKSLSIVIPVYNEAERILHSLRTIEDFLSHCSYDAEVIIVDDGSTDNTLQLIRSWHSPQFLSKIISLGRNYGKGRAVQRGILKATKSYVLFTDADLSTPINETIKLLNRLDSGFDVAVGSRRTEQSLIEKAQTRRRQLIGWVFRKVLWFLHLDEFKDTQCGFKMFTYLASREVFSQVSVRGFVFDVEALLIAKNKHLRISEVGIRWINDTRSTLNLCKHGLSIMYDLVRIRINLLLRKY